MIKPVTIYTTRATSTQNNINVVRYKLNLMVDYYTTGIIIFIVFRKFQDNTKLSYLTIKNNLYNYLHEKAKI